MADRSRGSAQPPGVLATIVGGLTGTAAVYLVGPPLANAVASDGLAGLGTALLVLFALWCVGTGLGVGVALAVRGHLRPVLTALLAIPGVFIAVMVTMFVGRTVQSGLLLWSLLLGASVATLWLARVLAMVSTASEIGPG